MPLIEEFSSRIDALIEVVQSVRASCLTTYEEHQEGRRRVDSDRQNLAQKVSGAAAAVASLTDLAVRLQGQLQQLEQDLLQEAVSLANTSQRQMETLESQGRDTGEQIRKLVQSVGAARQEAETRRRELEEAGDQWAQQLQTEGQELGQAAAQALASLDTSQGVATKTYNSALFAELSAGLRNLQTHLEAGAGENWPGAARTLKEALTGPQLGEVRESVTLFVTSAQEAQASHLASVQQNASDMRQSERSETESLTRLVAEELPETARRASVDRAEKALRQMAEETAKLGLVAGNMSAYLNKEQDPFLPAVRELHLALKAMLK